MKQQVLTDGLLPEVLVFLKMSGCSGYKLLHNIGVYSPFLIIIILVFLKMGDPKMDVFFARSNLTKMIWGVPYFEEPTCSHTSLKHNHVGIRNGHRQLSTIGLLTTYA